MLGFDFRYTLNGTPPTVRSLAIVGQQQVTRGDLLKLESGEVDPGVPCGLQLLGMALESKLGANGATRVDVIVDDDAVYSVEDDIARRRDDSLILVGGTGAQGVATGSAGGLTVVVDSAAGEPTLVRIGSGRHVAPPERGEGAARLNHAVARAVAGIIRTHVGHGPKRAEAFFHRNVIVVLLEGPLSTAERSLAAQGSIETVARMRAELQRGMRPELVAAIEELTGARVVGFISGDNFGPDVAAELFFLDRPIRPS